MAQHSYALTNIPNCIGFCSPIELALLVHNKKGKSDNKGIFKDLVNFSAKHDHILKL